ncbi:condensation domain-containing protein [Rhodomicrobium lacus]|uniref:condensation domain-containing protein n=1 Tax=Rhodomicrobium lacus TaxID=2498452 RepID=UPI001FE1ECA7|nr:condensation domain-containing protein [Rhodomicrobium lacus]
MHDIDPGAGWMPLTLPQLDFWEEFLFHPNQPLSTVAHCLEMDGEVDWVALLKAIAQSAREAEVLSMRFRIPAKGEAPLQRCDPDRIPTPTYFDLRKFPNPVAEARRRMDGDVAAKLDLRTDMLSTQALYRVGAKRYLWYSRAHHIIVDGYGLALIEQRCGHLYRHYQGLEDPGIPFHSFASFIEEETAYRESARWHADRAYWTNYLAQEVPVSVLDKSKEDYGGGGHHSDDKLEDEVSRNLSDLASSIDLGWPDALNLLTGAYLYHGLSPEEGGGRTRLTLWLPFMSRWGSVGAYTPAMLVNIIPFHIACDPKETLLDFLARNAVVLREQRLHGRFRIEQIAADYGLAKGQRFFFSPLINVLPFGSPEFRGCRTARHVLASGPGDGLNITYRGQNDGSQLTVQIDADAAIIGRDRFDRHRRALRSFLATAVAPGAATLPMSELLRQSD